MRARARAAPESGGEPTMRHEPLSLDDRKAGRPPTPDAGFARERRFVRRLHRMRTLGLGLGALCVASVLRLHEAPLGWWLLLAFNGLLWPHVALFLSSRSTNPRRMEIRNLLADSALGGMWIAVMQFNLLPSVLVATMLAIDKVSVGGERLLLRTLASVAAGCAVTSALLGFPVSLATPMSVIVACMPLLVVYPVAIIGIAFGLARRVAEQNRRLEELGRTDVLTGLANRRQGLATAESELARHFRTGRPAALIVLDIDYFKRINDRYGHPAGDAVLRGVADVLRECCRATDTPARYGGDEFLLILPETDLRGAEEAAARIRRTLAAATFELAPGLECTVSIGAAEANREIVNVDAWIQRADAALYRAKGAGRDRFEGGAAAATEAAVP